MGDINWVAALAFCELAIVFEKLRLQVKDDVQTRNAQLKDKRANYSLKFISTDASFGVTTVADSTPSNTISFKLTDATIAVFNTRDEKLFEAMLTLNDAGECRLLVGDKEMELWKFRQKALQGLLFRSPYAFH
jgi:hypothetical protein